MKMTCPEYLMKAEACLAQENARGELYLAPQTKMLVQQVVIDKVLQSKANFLTDMNTGCLEMFQGNQIDNLALMYRMFKLCTTALTCILDKMQGYIETKGKLIVVDPELVKNPITFTQRLLDFKCEMDVVVEKSFLNDVRFQKCRDNSFQIFMNRQELTPQYISAYCDSQMRAGFKGLQESEVTCQLDALVRLFCCLNGRDIFIKSYTRYFGYRLLNKSYLSKDFE